MRSVARKVSPAVLILAALCFFLPFVTFSCGGSNVLTLSGLQLVTGTTLQQPQPFGPPRSQKIDPEPLAVLALLVVLGGLGLSFAKGKRGALGSASLAGLGVIFLAALESKLDSEAMRQGGGTIQAHFEAGYYFSLILLLAAAGIGVYTLLAGKGLPLPALQSSPSTKFCTHCGARNAESDLFCGECGSKFP